MDALREKLKKDLEISGELSPSKPLEKTAAAFRKGRYSIMRSPWGHRAAIALWLLTEEGRMEPAGIFALRSAGFFNKQEIAELRLRDLRISLRGSGRTARLFVDEKEIGKVAYSWRLKHLLFGRATIFVEDEMLCEMEISFNGPTGDQRKDHLGRFLFPEGFVMHYVNNPKARPLGRSEFGSMVKTSPAASGIIDTLFASSSNLFSAAPNPEGSPILRDFLNSSRGGTWIARHVLCFSSRPSGHDRLTSMLEGMEEPGPAVANLEV